MVLVKWDSKSELSAALCWQDLPDFPVILKFNVAAKKWTLYNLRYYWTSRDSFGELRRPEILWMLDARR